MSDFATLNNQRITTASISIPYYGAWVADIVIANPSPISSAVTLTVANLTLKGHVKRMASFSGARSARIVGGFGGWATQLPARAYQMSSGINMSLILGDAATEVGEKLSVVTDSQIGTNFVREAAPAERLLRQLAGPLWYVDNAGNTVVGGTRANTSITTEFQVITWSGGKGQFQIATEDLASWMPGRRFVSPTVTTTQTVSMVRFDADNEGKLRIEVLAS